MNISSFSFYSGVVGIIAVGISLLGSVVTACRAQLPSNKVKTLETLLHAAETTFKDAVEAGLLEHEFIKRTERHLKRLQKETCSLRTRVYAATTLRHDCAEFFRGTSISIGTVCRSIERLRAQVITCSEETRHMLMEMDSAHQALLPVPPLNMIPEAGRPPIPPPAAKIRCYRACPPALSAWIPDCVLTNGNPVAVHVRGDSDVRITDVRMRISITHTSVNVGLEA